MIQHSENFEQKGAFTRERDVARELGVTLAAVRKVRQSELLEGEHWTKEGNGWVAYTEAGEAKLAALFGVSDPPEKKKGGPEPVELTVARICPNTKLVLAWDEERRPVVRVQVRNSANLRPGMKLWPCLPVTPAPPNTFQFVGMLPRVAGRWAPAILRYNENLFPKPTKQHQR